MKLINRDLVQWNIRNAKKIYEHFSIRLFAISLKKRSNLFLLVGLQGIFLDRQE